MANAEHFHAGSSFVVKSANRPSDGILDKRRAYVSCVPKCIASEIRKSRFVNSRLLVSAQSKDKR